MTVYFAFLFFLSLFSVIDFVSFYPLRKKAVAAGGITYAALFIIIICGFRYKAGPDYSSYEYFFDKIVSSPKNFFVFEPSFSALCVFFGKYGSFRLMLLCVAVFSVGYKLRFFYKESDAPFLSVLLYFSSLFLGQDFGQIRQGVAFCFTTAALMAAYDRKPARFFFLTLLAASFHYSAAIILPFYFMGRVQRLSGGKIVFLMAASLLLSFCFVPLAGFMVKMLHIPYLTVKAGAYLNDPVPLASMIIISVMKLTIIGMYLIKKNILLTSGKKVFMFNLYALNYCLQLLFMRAQAVSGRAAAYFDFFELILVANIIKVMKPKERIVFCLLVIAYAAVCVWRNVGFIETNFVPYHINFDLGLH